MLPTTIIGLVRVNNTANETAYALQGAIHFVSGSGTWGTKQALPYLRSSTHQFGNIVAQVYFDIFGGLVTKAGANTFEDSVRKDARIQLQDPNNSTSSRYALRAGASHYFLAAFRRTISA